MRYALYRKGGAMQEHYYSKKPASGSSPTEIRYKYMGRSFLFRADSGVFSKDKVDRGTDLLLEALECEKARCFMDMGCGYGLVGICYGAVHSDSAIYMADINERACKLAQANATLNGVLADVRQSDGFAAFDGVIFDCIAMNPPIRAGKQVVRGLMSQAIDALEVGGRLYVVIRTRQGAASLRGFLEELFGACEEPERGSGYRVLKCCKT